MSWGILSRKIPSAERKFQGSCLGENSFFSKKESGRAGAGGVGANQERNLGGLGEIVVHQFHVFGRELQSIAGVAAVITNSVRILPGILLPTIAGIRKGPAILIHQQIGGTPPITAVDGLEIFNSDDGLGTVLDGSQEQAAHLGASLGDGAETAHYFVTHALQDLNVQVNRDVLAGHGPNVRAGYILCRGVHFSYRFIVPFTNQPHNIGRMATLFIVATPIGNLEDITLRAVRVLREVSLIACEDTRHTRKLLDHLGITTPATSYHEHNEAAKAEELIEKLQSGSDIALVSDAGTPLISDPGYRIVAAAVAAGIPVVPIPGPSAILGALAGAGLPTDSFRFGGFLPPKVTQRRKILEELRDESATLVFYEAPHRILEALADVEAVMGTRSVVIARE